MKLTAQAILDIEGLRKENQELREKAGRPLTDEEIEEIKAEARKPFERDVEDLKAQHSESIKRKDKDHSEALLLKDGQLASLQAEAERRVEAAKADANPRVEAAKADANVKIKEMKKAMSAEMAERVKASQEEMKRKVAPLKETIRALEARLAKAHEEAASEVEGRWGRLAYVPLGMRVSAVAIDGLILALAVETVRDETAWGRSLSGSALIVGTALLFATRAFASPGNLLLGISARRIGPDHRPDRPAGLGARLVCGVLHYGLIVATAAVAASDETTRDGLLDLAWRAFHPLSAGPTLGQIMENLLRPTKPGLPGLVLATTLAWWGLLLLGMLFSPLIHRGLPYFRNTTLVEWMWRVGFRRFRLPDADSPRPLAE